MRLYRINEAPIDSSDTVFRESACNKAFGAILFFAIAVVFVILARRYDPPAVFYIMAGVWGLFALVFLSIFIKTLGPANWLVRFNANGVVVKFRSYKDTALSDEDAVVFELNFNEIAWARKSLEKLVIPGHRSEHTKQERCIYLDLKPKSADLSELRDRLAEEQRRPPVGWRGKWLDSSVRVVEGEDDGDGEVIRITWQSGSSRVTPRVEKALRMLQPSVGIRIEQRSNQDFRAPAEDEAEQESRIAELLARGQKMEAITLARRYYGHSLSQASRFIDELQKKA
jgi:hypothetical protein